MKKQLQKSLSLLLMLVMLLSLLPTPAQAVGKEPGIPIPTTLTFTTEPQSGTALKTEGYTITWATNKTPDILLLQARCGLVIRTAPCPQRQKRFQIEAGVGVRILVTGHVQSILPGFLNQGQCGSRLVPVLRSGSLQVRDLRPGAGSPRDADHLIYRFQHRVALASHVPFEESSL